MIIGRNFYDQPINDLVPWSKNYQQQVSTGLDDDYTTGCLLDFAYFKDSYRPIAVYLNKQKALDTDPRAV